MFPHSKQTEHDATVHVLTFVGTIFVFLISKKIRGVLIFMAMAVW